MADHSGIFISINNLPLWKAYLNALDYFKFDGWFIYVSIELKYENLIEEGKRIIKKDEEKIEVEYFYHTPEGSLHTIILMNGQKFNTKI